MGSKTEIRWMRERANNLRKEAEGESNKAAAKELLLTAETLDKRADRLEATRK